VSRTQSLAFASGCLGFLGASASLTPATRAATAGDAASGVFRPHNISEWEADWAWRRGDGDQLWAGAQVCFVCATIAAGFLALGAVATHSQRRALEQRAAAESGAHAPESPEDAGGHVRMSEAEACGPHPPSKLRAFALVCIGLSPLITCVGVGENMQSVLVAMVLMHWGAMLILPAAFYAAASFSGHGYASYRFYIELFREQQMNSEAKTLRGCALGVPVLILLLVGYLSFRCKTLSWPFCIKDFIPPLEQYGFEAHSMSFRLIAAGYFTFWNPAIEEFFWRVFLHRELGLALGFNPKEEKHLLRGDADGGPWRDLLHETATAFPGRAIALRWGVSAMYAAYHTWPMKLLFQRTWWLYTVLGFCCLVCLGRFFLILREMPHFGLIAAYILHAWVDAAFALLCLFHVHPYDMIAEP